MAYVHSKGMFHRDIKPENLLVRTHHPVPIAPSTSSPHLLTPLLTVKLADFGLAKDIRSRPPFTSYVSTRWYRAPELLAHSPSYSSPIDVWACACIMAELLTLTPLFPGTTEVDMLSRIAAVVQSPSDAAPALRLRERLKGVDDDAVKLLEGMLQWEPRKRLSARDALRHDYFAVRRGLEVESAAESLKEREDEERTVAAATGRCDEGVGEEWTINTVHGAFRTRYFPAPSNSPTRTDAVDASALSPPSTASSKVDSTTFISSSPTSFPACIEPSIVECGAQHRRQR